MANEKCIEVCNKLLRGELSAVETYQQALDKFNQEPQGPDLRQIQSQHEKSAATLRENIISMGGAPSDDSGAWGTFAMAVQGSAKLFGEQAALSALKQGEEHGESLYESALDNEDVMSKCKLLIKNELLPRQINHISTIEQLIEAN